MSSATYAAPTARLRTAPRTAPASNRPSQRRLLAVLALVAAVFAVLVVLDRGGAQAGLEDEVAGHVVVEPGESLWDVAAATAPDGVDPRQQLEDLRTMNGLDGAQVDAWTVVLIPAR